MTQSPETNVEAVKRLPRDENRKATSWIKAGEWFASTYSKPLLAFVRAKLAGGGVPWDLAQNAKDYLQEFFAREWDHFPVCSNWNPHRGHFHPYLRTAVSNFVDSKLLQDSPPGTPEEYEPHRKPLEAHVRQELMEQVAQQGGGSVQAPARLLLAEDYVRAFLEYYASRHPRPPRPREESTQTGGEAAAAESPEKTSEREAILARLKGECWKYVLDESGRRAKRRGRESLDGRGDGWEPVACAVSPSVAYARTWAIDLLFEALAAWRGTCHNKAGQKRWNLFSKRVLTPFYSSQADKVPPFKDIYEQCGYTSPKKAANAFETAKAQIMKCLDEVLEKRARNFHASVAGSDGSDADLQRRVAEELQQFQDLLAEDYFWHHASPIVAERCVGKAERGVLRRYAERKLSAAGARDSDPSASSGLEDDPDLSQYDLTVIALAFSEETAPNEKLARQWQELVSRPWPALLANGEEAGRFAAQVEAAGLSGDSSLGDVLRHPQTPLELLQAIREAAERRRIDAEQVEDRVLNAVEQTCIAAALASHGRRITSKEDGRVLRHLDWLIERRWLDEPTRQLAVRARAGITAPT